MIPACVIAGVVIVGDIDMLGDEPAAGSIAFARPKSKHLHRAVRAHFDVRGLEIAMDDALLVRALRAPPRSASRSAAPHRSGSRRARSAATRSSPSTSSITSAETPLALFEPVDAGNVRMVQRGEHFRFALKTREPIVVSRERRRQDLDGDLALQLRVGRPIHLPHPAFADLGGDFVDAEAGAGVRAKGLIIGPDASAGRILPH